MLPISIDKLVRGNKKKYHYLHINVDRLLEYAI